MPAPRRAYETDQLDQIITLTIRHNFRRERGKSIFDTATRRVWARRVPARSGEDVDLVVSGQQAAEYVRWIVRGGGDPPIDPANTQLDSGDESWVVGGVEPIGRDRLLELFCQSGELL